MSQSSPGGENKDPPGNFDNIIALIAVLVLVALGYWAFNSLNHSGKFQRCLDSGRRNCWTTSTRTGDGAIPRARPFRDRANGRAGD